MQKNPRFKIRDGVLLQKLDDEIVLLEPDTGNYFTLDAVGAFMLERLCAGFDCNEIIQQTLTVYDALYERAQSDLNRLIEDLQREGLLSQRV